MSAAITAWLALIMLAVRIALEIIGAITVVAFVLWSFGALPGG